MALIVEPLPSGYESPSLGPPAHDEFRPIEEIIRVTTKLHADHHKSATRSDRVVDRVVDLAGRPGFIGLLLVGAFCWIGGNALARALGLALIDAPPFFWLDLVVSMTALCMTFLILTMQRRADQLVQQRQQMTLELVVLSEQKLAKVIQLLEESRRDNPLLDNRIDLSADAMALPADPQSLGDAIKRGHRGNLAVRRKDAEAPDLG